MKDDLALLAESNNNSSEFHDEYDITPAVSPTIVAQAQQQTSQQLDTSVEMPAIDDDDSEPRYSWIWYIFKLIGYCTITWYMVTLPNRVIANGINSITIPYLITHLLFWGVVSEHYERASINLVVILLPSCAMFAVVVVGTIVSPITAILFPWLIVSLLIARILQLVKYGDAYDNVTALKLCIRAWICQLYLLSVGPALAVLLTVASYSPSLRSLLYMVKGFPRVNYINWWCSAISLMFILSMIFLVIILYFVPRLQLDHSESGINIPDAVLEIADCLNVLYWMKIMRTQKLLPYLFQNKILELEAWKWIRFSVIIVICYNLITLATHFLVWLLRKLVCRYKDSQKYRMIRILLRGRYLVYWINGMKHNIAFILTSLCLLLAWLLCHTSQLQDTTEGKKVLEFGTWTSLSFLVCAFLWLIKTCITLFWEADSIYTRLESQILRGGKQLYFLGIMGRHSYDIFNLMYFDDDKANRTNANKAGLRNQFRVIWRHFVRLCLAVNLDTHFHTRSDVGDKWENEKKVSETKKERAKEYLLMMQPLTTTIYDVQQVALYFLMAKTKLSEEKYTSVILQKLQSYNQDPNRSKGIEETLNQLIGDESWNDFQHQLDEYKSSSETLTFETKLQEWMEKAHNNCLFLANTLSSAKEVADCLDKIISSLLIFGIFIMWLLLTKLATTKVLVLVATPLLAITFIFQNACKILFDGLMFAYVVHPFNVGDLCTIDEKMMEVRTVGVWKTSFTKVSTREEVIYSNSELSNKNIINHKTEFDWNDSVELDAGCQDIEKIKNLKQEIEKYLEDDKFTPGYNFVEVLTTANSIKLAVHFRHKVNLQNNSFFGCFKEKCKLRSEFILDVENLVDRNKTGNSSTSGTS